MIVASERIPQAEGRFTRRQTGRSRKVGARQSSAGLASVPIPIALLLLALLVPTELDFHVGTLRLSVQRVVMLALVPVAVTHLLMRGRRLLRSFDFLFIGAFAYYAATYLFKMPFDKGLQSAGIAFIEPVGNYLLARVYIRNSDQFLAVVKLLLAMAIIAGAFAVPEALMHVHFAHHIAGAISGTSSIVAEERFGMLRAMSVFEHPIHYGVFCTTVFGLYWFAERHAVKRLAFAILIIGFALLALSSAPLLGIVLIIAAACWEKATRGLPRRTWIALGLCGLAYCLLLIAAKRTPVEILVSTLVFNPSTSWYRIAIWENGIQNVLANPWIGMPFGYWVRPDWMVNDTLDNFWLAMAVWGGLPSLLLLVSSIIVLLRAVHVRSRTGESPDIRRCRHAWIAAFVSMCIVGVTVHFWGALAVLFSFCLGLGAWLQDPPASNRVRRPL